MTGRLKDERGVFIPGLMGAGILVSIVTLALDGIRRVLPFDGERSRQARMSEAARGRVDDLMAIADARQPHPFHVHRIPRPAASAFAHGAVALGMAVLLAGATLDAYQSSTGVLAQRGWTLAGGLGTATVLALMGVVWLTSAVSAAHRPGWLERAAGSWPLGILPGPGEEER